MISMASIYLPSMFIVWLIGHYGVNSRYQSKTITWMSLVTIFSILFFISGFRANIGDTYFYRHTFTLIGDKLKYMPVKEVLAEFTGEQGFYYMITYMNLITSDPQILMLVCAFITNALNLYCIYKYAKPFDIAIYLYFATVIFYVTMNGMRQALVASVFFWSVRFIIKGNWLAYFIIILILRYFHSSAILLLPVYFIARQKPWGKVFWTICGAGVSFFIAFPVFSSFIVTILNDTSYAVYGQDMQVSEQGVSLIRVMIMLVPPVLAYMVRDKLKETWEESSIFIYMSVLNFLFILLGVRYLYFYRVCIYFELFNLALLPRILGCLERKKANCLYVYMIVCYFIFAYYQTVICWGEYYRNILL